MDHYSAIKRDKLLIYMHKNTEETRRHDDQTQEATYCMIPQGHVPSMTFWKRQSHMSESNLISVCQGGWGREDQLLRGLNMF